MDRYQDMPQEHMESKQKEAELCDFLCKRLGVLENERRFYEHVWDEITEYVLPSRGGYSFKDMRHDPERKSKRRVDSTAINAARVCTARIIAEMTGTSSRWFDYRIANPDIDNLEIIRRILQNLSDKAYGILNSSSFRLAHVEATSDWVAYGTACMFMGEDEGQLVFKAIPVQELYIAENKFGEVDVVFRKFKLSVRQAAQMWDHEKFPDSWHVCLKERPDEEVEVLHCVIPNEDYMEGAIHHSRFRFKSVYMTVKDRCIVHMGGFKRMPYKVFRFWKRSGEVYGGSLAMDAMADIRMLNMMEEANIRSVQLEAFPPMVMAHDSVIMPLKVVPNGINYGGLSPDGRRLIDRLIPQGGNGQKLENMLEQKRMAIRSAFFVDPLINRENSIRTAAEVAKRSNEEMVGIAPFINRYEVEYLTPVLDHVLEYILSTDLSIVIPPQLNGLLPTIEYTAPLAKTQRAQELNNTLQFMQVVQTMAAANPDILMHIDSNQLFLRLADLMGVPYDVIVPAEVIAAQKAQQAQMQQQQMMLQGVQMAGDQMANLAKSGLIAREDIGLPPVEEGF